MRTIKCVLCGEDVVTKSHKRKYCNSCQILMRKVWDKSYYAQSKIRAKEWYYNNKELAKEKLINWRKKNPDKLHEQLSRYANKSRFGSNRNNVLERDKYQCQICGSKEKLVVHHIDGTGRGNETHNNDLDNLITVCRSCHAEIHKELLTSSRMK